MRFSIVFFFLVVLFTLGCNSDKNKQIPSSKPKIKKETTKNTSDLPQINIPSSGMETKDLSHIQTLKQEELMPFLENYGKNNPEQQIQIETRFGNIIVQLFDEPIYHRANFIRLIKLGYFDTCLFHRVDPNFVIQGGNSDRVITRDYRTAIGRYLIPSEYTDKYQHHYGAFAAAKYKEQNVSNASSPFEFYIVTKKDGAHHLDGEHTVFGRVIKGMEVAEKISRVDADKSEWPIRNVDFTISILD